MWADATVFKVEEERSVQRKDVFPRVPPHTLQRARGKALASGDGERFLDEMFMTLDDDQFDNAPKRAASPAGRTSPAMDMPRAPSSLSADSGSDGDLAGTMYSDLFATEPILTTGTPPSDALFGAAWAKGERDSFDDSDYDLNGISSDYGEDDSPQDDPYMRAAAYVKPPAPAPLQQGILLKVRRTRVEELSNRFRFGLPPLPKPGPNVVFTAVRESDFSEIPLLAVPPRGNSVPVMTASPVPPAPVVAVAPRPPTSARPKEATRTRTARIAAMSEKTEREEPWPTAQARRPCNRLKNSVQTVRAVLREHEAARDNSADAMLNKKALQLLGVGVETNNSVLVESSARDGAAPVPAAEVKDRITQWLGHDLPKTPSSAPERLHNVPNRTSPASAFFSVASAKESGGNRLQSHAVDSKVRDLRPAAFADRAARTSSPSDTRRLPVVFRPGAPASTQDYCFLGRGQLRKHQHKAESSADVARDKQRHAGFSAAAHHQPALPQVQNPKRMPTFQLPATRRADCEKVTTLPKQPVLADLGDTTDSELSIPIMRDSLNGAGQLTPDTAACIELRRSQRQDQSFKKDSVRLA